MSEVENDLSWLKEFFLACNGKIPEPATFISRGQLAATMVSSAEAATLARWGVMKAATLGLGWNSLGHLPLTDAQIRVLRSLGDDVRHRRGLERVEIECIQTFVPHVPLGCGLVFFGRSFVFIIKVQAFWLRIVLDHPAETHRLMRLAFLGPLIQPWGGKSGVATPARVEHFECATGREEQELLTEGVVPFPAGFEWADLTHSPMPMDVYRMFIPRMRELVEAWIKPKGGVANGGESG
ncbi:MAG: hypothetical protein KAI24_18130 [Planctomycetes bacterium]|nr:hypothetical protein [Planctomycetota bacterium]